MADKVEKLIKKLRNKDSYVREAAASALEKIDPNWAKTEEAKRQVPEFIAALRDKEWDVRYAAASALGKIGDIRVIKPLIAALRDKDRDVREAAEKALKRINELQFSLLNSYPYLLCQIHYLRSEKKKAKIGFLKSITYIACRGCGSSISLITGVKEVVGLIGGDIEDYKVDGDRFYVKLWLEDKEASRNADIDLLEIRPSSKKINYELAIASVYRTLYNDLSRPNPEKYIKGIPVFINDISLSEEAMNMLERKFGGIKG